jgi:hypothetical protein
MTKVKCIICGKEFDTDDGHGYYSTEKGIVCSSNCFDEYFWREKIDEYKKDHSKIIVANHRCYYIEDEKSSGSFRGFGGHQFNIRLKNTDEVITTTNLWFNGDIPAKYQSELVDNGEFVEIGGK